MREFFKKIIIFILNLEARICIWRHKPKIIAITGSVGKTSTKDAVFSVLKDSFYVRKSEKSFNSEIGLPLSILGLENAWNNPFYWILNIFLGLYKAVFSLHYPEWLILELGVDHPGDMEKVSKWLKTDIVVFTQFGTVPVHVEFFNSPEEIIKEKSKLLHSLKKDGVLILNYDDRNVLALKEKSLNKTITFGFSEDVDMQASNADILYEDGRPSGTIFRADYSGNSLPVRIAGALGRGHIYPALVALSVGLALNMNIFKISEVLSSHRAPLGRMNIIEGVSGSIIIDDTYNSSPVAVGEALSTLEKIETSGRKIAVLGDMMELGRYSDEEHKKVGELASSVADIIVAVGIRAKGIAESALLSGMSENNVLKFDSSIEAGDKLKNLVKEDDVILVKGSQSMRMERVVEKLMAKPDDKKKLLVRQDKEWLGR